MLDPKLLRTDLQWVAERLSVRNITLDTGTIASLDQQRRSLQQRTEELQAERNARARAIGQAKSRGEDIEPLLAETSRMGDELERASSELARVQAELDTILLTLPNIVDASVPAGRDESDNIELRKVGTPRSFDYEPLDHVDIGSRRASLDFETATRLTGSRFAVLRGELAMLHRALIQFMLDVHTREHGYTEINVPYIVNADTLKGTGQLPKFEEDLFRLVREDAATRSGDSASRP